jgi:hypothetical protein
MKKPVKFWLIFIPALMIVFAGWYFTSYKSLKSASWSMSLGAHPEIKNGIDQSFQKMAEFLETSFKQMEEQTDSSSATSTDNKIIQELKDKIKNNIYDSEKTNQ